MSRTVDCHLSSMSIHLKGGTFTSGAPCLTTAAARGAAAARGEAEAGLAAEWPITELALPGAHVSKFAGPVTGPVFN